MPGTLPLTNGTVQVTRMISCKSIDPVTTSTFKHKYFQYRN